MFENFKSTWKFQARLINAIYVYYLKLHSLTSSMFEISNYVD